MKAVSPYMSSPRLKFRVAPSRASLEKRMLSWEPVMLNLKRGSGIGANGRYKSTWHVLVGFASILR